MKRQCNGWRGWAMALAAGLLLGITGCSTVPITGRSQLSLISSQQELQLGLASFQEIKKGTKISQDPAANALLQKVGKRIAAVTGNDLPDAQWEFVVFESAEPNAFCLPGGKVGVYTGILPITKDEAGLATVIGHEVAHAVAHHGRERISEAMLMQMGGQVANLTLNMTAPEWTSAGMLAYGVGTKLGRELPHSRTQESEADQMGLMYMARAGYDPTQAVRFWERFRDFNQAHGGDSTPSFLRTHPLDNVRIKKLQEWMSQAEAEYRATGGAPK